MERNPVFDIMKGITIILVIVGHVSWLPLMAKKMIFSFHMPLFFILSGLFSKKTPVIKDVVRLIVPYIATGLLLLLFHFFSNLPSFSINILEEDVLKLLWGSGGKHVSPVGGRISAIGAVWFLLALFWCKRAYLYLSEKVHNSAVRGGICILISIVAILFDHKIFNLPFAILPGLAAIIFFYIGDCMKRIEKTPLLVIVIISACWCFSICKLPILALVNCTYPIYPISVLGACGGTFVLYHTSMLLSKVSPVAQALSFLGKITLPVLCFHLFQINTKYMIPSDTNFGTIVSMVLFPILLTVSLSNFEVFRLVFGIHINKR